MTVRGRETLVRPIVEYSSSVWDPYTQEHTQEIGKVQRRAARMVCNDYRQTTSATKLMVGLGWDLLSIRRKVSRVCILHKALGGGLALSVSDYLRPAPRATRRTSGNSNTPPAPIVLNTPTFHVPSRTGTHYPPTSKGPRTSTPSNSKQPTFSATKTQAIRTKQAQCAPPHPPRLVPYGTLRSIPEEEEERGCCPGGCKARQGSTRGLPRMPLRSLRVRRVPMGSLTFLTF